MKFLVTSTKYEGGGGIFSNHYLKIRGSFIKNVFVKCRTKKTHFLRDEMMHFLLQIKQNIYSIGFLCSCSDMIHS